MRVIYTHIDRWASQSSGPSFVTYTAWGLAQNDVETHLVVWNQSEGHTENILRDNFGIHPQPEKLHIHRLEARSRGAYLRKAKKLNLELADRNTALYSSAAYNLKHMLAVRKATGCKVFYEAQDFHLDLSGRDDIRSSHKRKSKAERHCLPHFDGIVCVAEAQAVLFRKHLHDQVPVAVMRNGIYRIHRHNSLPAENHAAYIGSLGWRKGVGQLTDFAAALPPGRKVHILGGRGKDDLETLEQGFREKGGWANVKVHDWMTPTEMHKVLANIRWGLIPLRDTYFNRHLTSPTKIFDSFAHGAPVIATDLPCTRELVEHGKTGFLVDWNQGEEIARLTDLSDEEYQFMREQVLASAEDFTWLKRGEKLSTFFAQSL